MVDDDETDDVSEQQPVSEVNVGFFYFFYFFLSSAAAVV